MARSPPSSEEISFHEPSSTAIKPDLTPILFEPTEEISQIPLPIQTEEEKLPEEESDYEKIGHSRFERGLMPEMCYSCGKPFEQPDIEKGIDDGESLAEIMNRLGYIKICCRSRIVGSSILIGKLKAREKNAALFSTSGLTGLTIENTGVFRHSLEEVVYMSKIIEPVVDDLASITVEYKKEEGGFASSLVATETPNVTVFDEFMAELDASIDTDEE